MVIQCADDPPLFDLTDNRTNQFLDGLETFNDYYTVIHRYLCLVVCTVGVFLNSLHVFVLSRRTMRTFIINALLCAMAVCDCMTMFSYLIYILRFRIFDTITPFENVKGYPYSWLVFLIFHVTASIALHTGSLYLSVAMAYIRWTALDRLDAKWINHAAIRHIFVFTGLAVTIISIPTLLLHRIDSVNNVLGTDERVLDGLYTVTLSDVDVGGCTLFRVNLWISGIMFKAVPCFLLLWFTIALVIKLCEMSEKRKLLRGVGENGRKRSQGNNIAIDKTTLMLVIMLVVFLFTELPQGILAILSAIYPTHVHVKIYVNVGELLDLLSLVNCLTSFVLYCCMSSTYRNTVKSIFFVPASKSVSTAQRNSHALKQFRLLLPVDHEQLETSSNNNRSDRM